MQPKAESLSETIRQLLRGLAGYVEAVAFDVAIKTGKKLLLFAMAITCLSLALIYLTIGLLKALGSLFSHPAPPYLILGAVLLLIAVVALRSATDKKKADRDARHPEETESEATAGD
jgi:amino acid permease